MRARFTEQGGATVAAELHNRHNHRQGHPIPARGWTPQSLNRLFEPFQQLDQSIRRSYGGTGLGLTISKRFVEMHGGRMWLESKPGLGSTASFTLPQDEPTPDEAPLRWLGPAAEYVAHTRPSLAPQVDARRRLVVVEQGDDMCSLLQRYLDDVEPVSVRTLAEATRVAGDQAAAALIVNDPLIALQLDSLSSLPFDIPILSCWVPERRAAIHGLGGQDYLVKPIARTDPAASRSSAPPPTRAPSSWPMMIPRRGSSLGACSARPSHLMSRFRRRMG